MVSKIVALSLAAMLASSVNAFSWYAHITYKNNEYATTRFKIHPIDAQVPQNEVALVWTGGVSQSENPQPPFETYGYGRIGALYDPLASGPELMLIYVDDLETPCTKIEQFNDPDDATITWKVYSCSNPNYAGRKGISVPGPTCPTVTATVPATTTNPPQTTTKPPKPTCHPGFVGKRKRNGPNGACCLYSDDCKNTCVNGVCGDHP